MIERPTAPSRDSIEFFGFDVPHMGQGIVSFRDRCFNGHGTYHNDPKTMIMGRKVPNADGSMIGSKDEEGVAAVCGEEDDDHETTSSYGTT